MHSENFAHSKEGKPPEEWQRLEEHLKNVAHIAKQLAEPFGGGDWAELAGWLHDVGKYSEKFQEYLKTSEGMHDPDAEPGMKGKIDHSTAGAQFLFRRFGANNSNVVYFSQMLAHCIMSHHSGLIDCIAPDGNDKFSQRIIKPDAKTHYVEVLKEIDENVRANIEKLLASSKIAESLNSKLKEIHDPDEESNVTTVFKWGLLVRLIFSCLIDADRIDAGNLNLRVANERNNEDYRTWDELIDRIEKELSNFKSLKKIDKIRNIVSKSCLDFAQKSKGLYVLTVPTGGGKTLSSLRFALHHASKHKMKRIIYVVPFTTIIDQNARKVRDILEDRAKNGTLLDKVILEHHSNLTPERETFRQSILAENWDAPIVFTTDVQFLEAIFGSGTRGARRMHQLTNAIMIFDEIQAIPISCVHFFNNALNFLTRNCASTAVLCTATQPLLDKVDKTLGSLKINPDQKIIQDENKLFADLKRVKIMDKRKGGGWSDEEIAVLSAKELKNSGSVLIIVNTKPIARKIYKQCRKTIKAQTEIYHLSTNMCPAHRMDVLENQIKKCLDPKKPKPVVCISTQLIEAGIDIDFGCVIRSLAGLDSVTQAAGRCNRNALRPISKSKVYIINPANENLDMLKDIKTGQEKAERVLDEFKKNPGLFDDNILGLKVMEQYFQYYFYQRAAEMKYPVNKNSAVGRDDNLLSLLSDNTTSVEEHKRRYNKAPPIPLRQSFMTASQVFQVINTPTQGIIVPYKKGNTTISKLCSVNDRDIKEQAQLLKKAQRYSVNVFENDFKNLTKAKAIYETKKESGIWYLDERYYSDEFGLSVVPVKDLGLLNT